ncbi:hypothetical protein JM93_02287 [Roseibium hamelinense]|uniref:Uncharacterized protein n=1 Tax=Roseibium hamelinense TaxID=150831 RepID=A0A562T2U7_9HYPH|nr:hypothetical protein [Roseibium hamelinense]MTI42031.1 hypothetical protein [Roseibium hamelinense]TWI87050.1 hypothetical protein JM93_02287 [Roseibium hamelinense]
MDKLRVFAPHAEQYAVVRKALDKELVTLLGDPIAAAHFQRLLEHKAHSLRAKLFSEHAQKGGAR